MMSVSPSPAVREPNGIPIPVEEEDKADQENPQHDAYDDARPDVRVLHGII